MNHKSKEFLESCDKCEIICKKCIEVCKKLINAFDKNNEEECAEQVDKCLVICDQTIESCKRFADHFAQHIKECKKSECIDLYDHAIEATTRTQEACTNCMIQLEQDQTQPPYTYGEEFKEWMADVVDACKTCIFRCHECIKYCQEARK